MHKALLFNNHNIISQRPGGVYRIATFLREHDWDIEVVDWTPYWELAELKELARQRITKETIFVGFSCFFSYWDDGNDAFCAWLKETFPHIKIILGAGTKPVITSKDIDYFVYGFGENAILAIVSSLTGNTPGTGIKFDPDFFGTKTKVVNGNDHYPSFPLRSLMIKYEDRDYIDSAEWLSIEFGRGCIFECTFCNFPVLGVKGDYSRDADDFVLQLRDAYDRFGVTNYYAADETFNDRSEKITKFANVVDQLPFRPFFSGFIRADLMVSRPQDWEPLMRLGFLGHFYGIETFNHQTGKFIKKGMHPDKLKEGILKAKDYFLSNDRKLYKGIMSLILGLPYETKETLQNTADWLCTYWKDECADMNPFEIPTDEKMNKLSIIGKDHSKFGYTELNEELWMEENFAFNRGYGRKNLIWKNEHMDYNWTRRFAQDFFKRPDTPSGLNPWALNAPMQTGMSLDEVIKLNMLGFDGSEWGERVKENFVKYKAKKLGVDISEINQNIKNIEFYDPSDKFERGLPKK
jgi:radical SAM superfamily enzyme YgiQ (UPF0313 family)